MSRLLFVHAHPDDESLWTGVALAHHVNAGDEVHVLTCTLGEEGEVIPEELKELELPAGQPRAATAPDPLADARREELRQAMVAMNVSSSVILGDTEFARIARLDNPGSYRDSGMAGTPSASHPRAFATAALDPIASDVAAYIQALKPDVVVTYDEQGGYGHPDHIRTHDVTVAALARLASEKSQNEATPTLFITLTPRSWAEEDRAWLHATCSAQFLHDTGFEVLPAEAPYPPSVVDDAEVTHAVIDDAAVTQQRDAARAHRTQITVADDVYALSNGVAARFSGREGYAQYDAVSKQRVAGTSISTLTPDTIPGLTDRV